MNFTTNTFGMASPFSQQQGNAPPMMQQPQAMGPGMMSSQAGAQPGLPSAQPPGGPAAAAGPGMSPQQKMMLVQMLQNLGNRQQQPPGQMNLAGVTGSTLPNNFLG